MICFFGEPVSGLAQIVTPPAGESGLGEKSLRQARPRFKPPQAQKIPEIAIPDSRAVVDPKAGPSFFVKKIHVAGNTLFDNRTLEKMVDVGEGSQATMGVLLVMAQEITQFYISKGYLLSRAYIPAQKIKDGTVRIQIIEGQVDRVEVVGARTVGVRDLQKRMARVMDEPILKAPVLERALLELNDQMGVSVRSLLKPGEKTGTSDLVLEVTETPSYSFGIDADNFGSEFTGRNRFGVRGEIAHLLTFGDKFSMRLLTSDLNQRFGNVTYFYPVNDYGTGFQWSYTYSEQRLGRALSALDAGGNTHLFNVQFSHPLFRDRFGRLDLAGGFDFRNFTNSRLGQTTSNDRIRGFFVSASGDYSDPWLGRNFFQLKINRGVHPSNQNRLLTSRLGGRGDATLVNLNLTRYQGTGIADSYFLMKAFGQAVSDRVLSPDQFAVGGMGTVRGYTLSELSGDNGYSASLEYVVPFPSDMSFGVGEQTLRQVMSFNAFIDYGRVLVKDKQPGEIDESITGAGAGITFNVAKTEPWGPSMSFSLAYGYPIFGPNPSDGSSGILYLSGALNFY